MELPFVNLQLLHLLALLTLDEPHEEVGLVLGVGLYLEMELCC